jgi:hypothetical protein
MLTNTIYGTNPIVVHDNGYSHSSVQNFFDMLCQEALGKLRPAPTKAADLTFFTWRNRNETGSFEQSLSRMGYECFVVGQEIVKWNHIHKIALTQKAMKEVRTEYVMACDSHDVVFLGDPLVVLEHFKGLEGCQMLFNAEKNHWPKTWPTRAFEESNARKPFCYLNSGVWIAKTSFAKELAEEAVAVRPSPRWGIDWDDQGIYKLLYEKHYPVIQVDDGCNVFQSLRDDDSVDWFLKHEAS